MLPQRRIELQLARVCQLIDRCMGGVKDAPLSDYLFDPPPEGEELGEEDDPSTEDLRAAFGFNPINVNPGDPESGQ